ncbi:hypothetical protein [Microbacterium sp. ZW T5_56]|uniref:hypothetical protein n=1 Tax=Microbacterium sp. ZW T5_56 TaxID=3378081 RepID=UPI003853E98F
MELTAEILMQGPRGRRLCLELAAQDDAVMNALFWAGHTHDPNPGTIIRMRKGEQEPDPVFSVDDVGRLISAASVRVDVAAISGALRDSVDSARYWQDPDGRDVIAAQDPVIAALRPIAEAVAEAAGIEWWTSAPAHHWIVDYAAPQGIEDLAALNPAIDVSKVREKIRDLHRGVVKEEAAAKRERPADPTHPISGSWWSLAGWHHHTVSRLPDALALMEDSYGPRTARTFAVRGGPRVLEIRTPEDWTGLCRRFSVDVSASRRHEWFRTTGRVGDWALPDWDAVAEEWDGVHLTVAAYLAGAGRALAVDEDRASVIAGWDPDTTYWFTNSLVLDDELPQHWILDDDDRWRQTIQNAPDRARDEM